MTELVINNHHVCMNNPTTAYDLLEQIERDIVDDYVQHVVNEQHSKRQRIAIALSLPIPSEFVRRSKGALNKPLVRVAVQERIQSLADDEDLSPSRVIREYAAIAHAKIKDYAETAEFGELRYKRVEDIPDEIAGAIKTIKQVPTAYGNRIEITLHDKLPALKVMAELMGLVAPDKPAPLRDYAVPQQDKKQLTHAPADAYTQLLEMQGA